MTYEFCCPTLFGLESIVANELKYGAKLDNIRVEDGRVHFSGDESTLVWANLWLRCAERVLVEVGSFEAHTFTELFDGVYEMPWLDYIEKDYAFPVKGYSLDSDLFSVPDCQKIIKKAIAKSLSESYGIEWFEESGPRCQVQFSIMKNKVTLYLDTTGPGLHKRGYRANANAAPLRETLAAALVKISRYRGRGEFRDPFCGSGTIAIEAAMIAENRAPGLTRSFDAENWEIIPNNLWKRARKNAQDAMIKNQYCQIFASDIDKNCVALAQENAYKAGVTNLINISKADACRLDYRYREGTLICNPPYGERLMDIRSAQRLMRKFGAAASHSPMSQYIISSDEQFERNYGARADKKRKLYNGKIKCNAYIYYKDVSERYFFPQNNQKNGRKKPSGRNNNGYKKPLNK